MSQTLKKWQQTKDERIAFTRLPAASKYNRIHAYAYYTAEELGIADLIHDDMYRSIVKEKKSVGSPGSALRLFMKHGINQGTFYETFRSLSVKSKVHRVEELQSRKVLMNVPTLIVNGKYRITPKSCRCSMEEMLDMAVDLALKNK